MRGAIKEALQIGAAIVVGAGCKTNIERRNPVPAIETIRRDAAAEIRKERNEPDEMTGAEEDIGAIADRLIEKAEKELRAQGNEGLAKAEESLWQRGIINIMPVRDAAEKEEIAAEVDKALPRHLNNIHFEIGKLGQLSEKTQKDLFRIASSLSGYKEENLIIEVNPEKIGNGIYQYMISTEEGANTQGKIDFMTTIEYSVIRGPSKIEIAHQIDVTILSISSNGESFTEKASFAPKTPGGSPDTMEDKIHGVRTYDADDNLKAEWFRIRLDDPQEVIDTLTTYGPNEKMKTEKVVKRDTDSGSIISVTVEKND